jgi:GIY-YIG catalytic domain/Cytochrome C and Quinol oxidase polypeptide I/NUMOD1 domain
LSNILNYKLEILQVAKEKREFSTYVDNEKKNLTFLSLKEPTEWQERWFLSSNAKDIGTLYLIFALFSGLIGTAFSVLIRLELSAPGVQYIADNQLYNSIITAHAIMMIFFMVKLNMLNIRSYSLFNKINTEYNDILIDGDNNNNNSKYKYTKILVDDPFNNRDIILKITKKQKGVYIWESLNGKNLYAGHSINLYNRISSYFMPSILNTKTRRVLRYLNKYGFSNTKLHIYIMDEKSTLEEVMELEQHFIDSLKPNLNVDLIASNSGYHEPMTQEMRDKLRKQIGTPVYVYRAEDLTLLYIFDSKQYIYDSINIHHKTLNDCLNLGTLYLDVFFLSLDLIEESLKTNIMNLEDFKILVNNNKEIYKVKHPTAKTILAEFKDDPTKNLTFNSLNSLANHFKGDRQVIRKYLKGNKSGYYRGKWKFTYQ